MYFTKKPSGDLNWFVKMSCSKKSKKKKKKERKKLGHWKKEILEIKSSSSHFEAKWVGKTVAHPLAQLHLTKACYVSLTWKRLYYWTLPWTKIVPRTRNFKNN